MYHTLVLFLSFALVAVSAQTACPASSQTVTLGGFFPFSGGWPVGAGVQPAFSMAIDDLNSRTDILPSYCVRSVWDDTMCDAGNGLAQFFERRQAEIDAGRHLTGVVGAGCSVVSSPMALLARHFQTPQVSWGSTSPALSDKRTYPYFMRTASPDDNVALVWTEFMLHFGWKRVSVIHSREEIHATTATAFQVLCKENNISVEAVENFFPGQPATATEPAVGYEGHFVAVDDLMRKEAAIIVMAAYQEDARVILDYALEQGLLGNNTGYVWLGTETWVNTAFWEIPDPLTNRVEDPTPLLRASQAVFGPTIFPGEGPAYDEFSRRMVQDYGSSEPPQNFAAAAYAAVHVFAIALHQVLEVEGLTEGTAEFSPRLMQVLRSVSIPDGLSGPVFFDENGDRIGLYVMLSLSGTDYVEVGRYILGNLTVEPNVVFPDGTTNVPVDSIDLDDPTFIDFDDPIAIAFMAVAGVFMVITLLIAVLVGVYRHTSVLKAASIPFMLIILFGLLMGFSLVFIFSAKPTDATCMLRPWIGGIAFVLVAGALLTKSYRMWKVFDNQSLVLVVVSNIRLLQYLTILMAIMLLILVLWTAIDPLEAVWKNDGILDQTKWLSCTSDNEIVWVVILFSYLGLLMLAAIVLAILTRKVVSVFNESRYIGLIIYSVFFIGGVCLVLSFVLESIVVAAYAISSGGILFCCGITLVALFFPKFFLIFFRREKADRQFDDEVTSSPSGRTDSSRQVSSPRSRDSSL